MIKTQTLTIIPIFFNASILVLLFLSFKLLKDIFTILNGDILSLFFIIIDNDYSVNLLYDMFKFDVLPSNYIILSKPLSVM